MLNCEGKINDLAISYDATVLPENLEIIWSKTDITYPVKLFSSTYSKYGSQSSTPKYSGSFINVEAAAETGKEQYVIQMPDWGGYSWTESQTHFSTKLTIKGGVVNGDAKLECKATLSAKTTQVQE